MAGIKGFSFPWYRDKWALGTTFFLVLVVFLVLYMARPPFPKPATAPATDFSAERALVYNRALASEPHPAGSDANIKVQQYIVDTMNGLGIPAEHVASPYAGGHSAGMRNMVLARLYGTANTKAIMFEAHYDSVPYGPGAADDCAGIAAMIEIARALKAGPPLKNDVIFVFSDAEECGMLGAKAFCEHPWFGDVGVLIGYETRGNRGKAYMFETGPENGWLIRQLAKSGVHTATSSCMADIYYRLPFRADFGIFKEAGLTGYNIAFVDNFAHYHTKNDNPDNLSLASLQDHGEYGIRLARHLGNIPIDNVRAPDLTYFTVAGPLLAYYPATWNRPLMGITIALFIVVLLLGLVRRHVTIPGILAGCLLFAVAALLTSAVQTGLLAILYGPSKLFTFVTRDLTSLPDIHIIQQNNLYGTAFALIGIATFVLIAGFFMRFVRLQHLAVGGLAAWLGMMFLLDAFLDGGTYAAQWSLLFGLLGLGLLFRVRDPHVLSPARVASASLFVIPGIVLLAPAYVAVLSFVFVIASPVSVLIPVLVLGLAIPQLALITRRSLLWLPAACAGVGGFLIMVGLLNSGPSSLRPQFNCVSYRLDLDTKQAFWYSSDPAPDEWTSQFFPSDTPYATEESESVREKDPFRRISSRIHSEPTMKAPAPVVESLGPEARIVSDAIENGIRNVVVRIESKHAESMHVRAGEGAKVLAASLFGKPLDAGGDRWYLSIHVFPREGVDLSLAIEPDKPFSLQLIQFSHGFHAIPGIKPRPAHMASEPNTIRRHKFVRDGNVHVAKTVVF